MDINNLIKEAHDNAVKHGFYDCGDCVNGRIVESDSRGVRSYQCDNCNGTGKDAKTNVYRKIIEEAAEFLYSSPSESFHKDSEQSELADIIIVCLAYAGEKGYNIERAINEKINYNKIRVYDNI